MCSRTQLIEVAALALVLPSMILLLVAAYLAHLACYAVSTAFNLVFGPLLNLALHGQLSGPFGYLEPVSGGLWRARVQGLLQRHPVALWFYNVLEKLDLGHCRRACRGS